MAIGSDGTQVDAQQERRAIAPVAIGQLRFVESPRVVLLDVVVEQPRDVAEVLVPIRRSVQPCDDLGHEQGASRRDQDVARQCGAERMVVAHHEVDPGKVHRHAIGPGHASVGEQPVAGR